MITHPKLITKLTTIDQVDAEKLRGWRNHPEVYKWCRQNDLISESHHRKWLDTHPLDSKIRMYVILNQSYKSIGVCGLTDLDLINQRAEFSLYIEPSQQAFGYGTDALKLLLWHGFNAYPLNIIWGESFAGNHAIKMFRRIGFKEEGVRRDFYYRDGRHIDATLVSIKKDELKL